MPSAELQDDWSGFYSLASTAMVDPKQKQKGSKAIVALNFRIWKLAKSLAALAGVGSITWIKPT